MNQPIKNTTHQSGQVLLIVVMLLATVLTVVMSITFTSVTETQITKLEEESQKALSAAEAAIDAVLEKGSGSVAIGTDLNISGFSGEATIDETTSNTVFITPLIQKDEQYTFYLSDYKDAYANPYNGNLTLYYGDQSSNCDNIALEITLVYEDDYQMKKWVADTNKLLGSTVSNIGLPGSAFNNVNFKCKTSAINIGTYSKAKVMIIRSLFSPTKIGFGGSVKIPVQGKTIVSTAKSVSGVTKTIQLFQSYPQIPTEFFVTSF